MTDTTAKTPARIHGYKTTLTLFVPVDKKSLKSQADASTALHNAEQAGDISGVLALPGMRLLAIKGSRYTSIPGDPAEAAAEEAGKVEEGEQLDIEDAAQADATADEPEREEDQIRRRPEPDAPEDEGDADVAAQEAQADDTYRGRRRRA